MAPRTWLAAVIIGGRPARPVSAAPEASDLLAAAREEGVVALVDWRLRGPAPASAASPTGCAAPLPFALPSELRDAFAAAAREEAMRSMLLEAVSRQVLDLLSGAGLQALLLKGTALAHWAYADPHLRHCSDVDLLLPSRAAAEQLAGVLAAAGFERSQPSGELVAYELMCTRQVGTAITVEVDIHWRLANSPLFADRFTWDELWAASIPLPALGANARGLGPVPACLHACVHRALNRSIGVPDKLKWLYDVELLAALFTPGDWQRLQIMAVEKGLAGVLWSGLQAASQSFGQRLPPEVAAALQEAGRRERLDATRLADWRYMQCQTFLALPDAGLRLRWLWQRLFPSRDYMQALDGASSPSYAGLFKKRLRRLQQRLRR